MSLQDGGGQKPSFNLRTLCRSLEYCRKAVPLYGLTRALADGLAMSFCTQLEERSAAAVATLIRQHIPGADNRNLLRAPPCPDPKGGSKDHVLFEEFWLEVSDGLRMVACPTLTSSTHCHLFALS